MKNPRRMSYNNALELVRLAVRDMVAETRAEFAAEDGPEFDPTTYDEEDAKAAVAETIEELLDVVRPYFGDDNDLKDLLFGCLVNEPRVVR